MGRVRKIVEGFLEALGRPRLKPQDLEALEKDDWYGGWYNERSRMGITLDRARRGLYLAVPPEIPYFTIKKWGESVVEVANLSLQAMEERAFFMARKHSDALSETLALVRGLKPLFQALGLGDLEDALLALGDLEAGAKPHGPYVLISNGKLLILRRGSLFGDLNLDRAFLLGEGVVLTYPEGEVTLSGEVSPCNLLVVSGFRIRWRGEVFPRDGGLLPVKVRCPVIAFDPIPCLLREVARAALQENLPPPPSLKELLGEIRVSKDPIKSLRDEELLRRVTLRLLSRL
jgi:hypothetical protein